MDSATMTAVDLFLLSSHVLRSGHGINWLSYVGLAEQAKAAEYRNPDDALNYAAQHTLMRAMAASALGIRPTSAAEIAVDRRCLLCDSGLQHGKPRIAGVNISMSRSSGMVAGAFAPGNMMDAATPALGVDIERLRGNFLDGYDRIALTETETVAVNAKKQEAAQMARLMLWTAKEAVLKATGHGLVAGPRSVELSPADFPTTLGDVTGYRSTGVLTLADQKPQKFWVSWYAQGEYCVAVAYQRPLTITPHPVSTPLEVKRVLESPAQ